MEYYQLRMDCDVVPAERCVELLHVHADGPWAYCQEGGETNPHIHGFFGTLTKQATVRKHLRELGLKGNGGYSLKACEARPVELLAYMMKEKRYNFDGLDPELVKEVKAHNVIVVEGIAKKKEQKKTVLQNIVEAYEKHYEGEKRVGYCEAIARSVIMEYYVEHGLLVRKFQLQAYRDTLRLRYDNLTGADRNNLESYIFD